jgi:hypothetical protein
MSLCPDEESQLDPRERIEAIASILARGVVRLRQRHAAAGGRSPTIATYSSVMAQAMSVILLGARS